MVKTWKGSIEIAEKSVAKNLVKEEVETMLSKNKVFADEARKAVVNDVEYVVENETKLLTKKSLSMEFLQLTKNVKITYSNIIDDLAITKELPSGVKMPFWVESGTQEAGWIHFMNNVRVGETLTRFEQFLKSGIISSESDAKVLFKEAMVNGEWLKSVEVAGQQRTAFVVKYTKNAKGFFLVFGENGFNITAIPAEELSKSYKIISW